MIDAQGRDLFASKQFGGLKPPVPCQYAVVVINQYGADESEGAEALCELLDLFTGVLSGIVFGRYQVIRR